MYRSRAFGELCQHLRTIFQIAVNGCNQKGCSNSRATTAPPCATSLRQVPQKVPNNQLESLLVKLTAVQVPSPACEPSRPEESVRGEQRCPNSTQRVDLPLSEQCRLTESLFQSCLHANEGVRVQESRGGVTCQV